MDRPESLTPVETTLPVVRNRTAAILYKWCACAAIALGSLVVAGMWHLGSNSMIACGFFGAAFIHFASRPSMKQIVLAVGSGFANAAIYVLLKGPVGTDGFTRAMGAGAFLGIGSILALAFERVIDENRDHARYLSDALVLPGFSLVAGIAMQIANHGTHLSYDFLLYDFDASLGIAPGRSVVDLFHRVHWISAGSNLVYAGLLLFPTLYHAWALFRHRAKNHNLMHVFVIAGLCGFAFYQVCPAMGPLYAFPSKFPDALPASAPLQALSSDGVNNAMPSMHMTWALSVWWSAWELGPLAVTIATAVVGFTGLATLGSGEHYLIDLIVAVPLVMGAVGIYRRQRAPAIAGLLIVAAWTLYLRLGAWSYVPAPIHWMMITATLIVPAAMMVRARRSGLQ